MGKKSQFLDQHTAAQRNSDQLAAAQHESVLAQLERADRRAWTCPTTLRLFDPDGSPKVCEEVRLDLGGWTTVAHVTSGVWTSGRIEWTLGATTFAVDAWLRRFTGYHEMVGHDEVLVHTLFEEMHSDRNVYAAAHSIEVRSFGYLFDAGTTPIDAVERARPLIIADHHEVDVLSLLDKLRAELDTADARVAEVA